MDITGVFFSNKGYVGSGYLFGSHNDSSLYNHVVTGRIILNTRSRDDITFIESFQLSIVSVCRSGLRGPLAYSILGGVIPNYSIG